MRQKRKKWNNGKNLTKLNRSEKEAFFMLPILNSLRKLSGQSTTKELKKFLITNCENIPEDVFASIKISRNGNFAVTNLVIAGYIQRPHPGNLVLTEKGRQFKDSSKELSNNVYKISLHLWTERSNRNKMHKHNNDENGTSSSMEIDEGSNEDWRAKLLTALEHLTPGKFEFFCRALVRKMNVDIDETLSGDDGIDGYGYIQQMTLERQGLLFKLKNGLKISLFHLLLIHEMMFVHLVLAPE